MCIIAYFNSTNIKYTSIYIIVHSAPMKLLCTVFLRATLVYQLQLIKISGTPELVAFANASQ